MRSEMGPQRDQDSEGWCYAYGVSDQLTHWMVKKGVPGITMDGPGRVSASSLALDYNSPARSVSYQQMISYISVNRTNLHDMNEQLRESREMGRRSSDAEDMFRAGLAMVVDANPEARRVCGQAMAVRATAAVQDRCWTLKNSLCQRDVECSRVKAEFIAADHAYATFLNGHAMFNQPNTGGILFNLNDGGNPEALIAQSLQKGVCLEGDIMSDNYDSSLGAGINTLLVKNTFEGYLANPSDETACRAENSIRAVFPHFNGDILAVLRNYQSADPIAEFAKSCRRTNFTPALRPQVRHLTPAQISAAIGVRPSEPVGIIYNADIFAGPVAPANRRNGSQHYSTLVGKRFNCTTQSEEWILRNSWGTDDCEEKRGHYRSVADTDSRMIALSETQFNCRIGCTRESNERQCMEACRDRYNQAAIALNDPPFYCEDNHYIFKKNQLMAVTAEANVLR